MRTFLLSAFVLVIAVKIGVTHQQAEQAPPRFDPPTVVNVVNAVYPLQSVVSGTVVLEVSLDDTGKIAEVRVVRGIPALTESAERSVRQWKFQPAKLDGKAVASKVPVAFSFVPPSVGPRF